MHKHITLLLSVCLSAYPWFLCAYFCLYIWCLLISSHLDGTSEEDQLPQQLWNLKWLIWHPWRYPGTSVLLSYPTKTLVISGYLTSYERSWNCDVVPFLWTPLSVIASVCFYWDLTIVKWLRMCYILISEYWFSDTPHLEWWLGMWVQTMCSGTGKIMFFSCYHKVLQLKLEMLFAGSSCAFFF